MTQVYSSRPPRLKIVFWRGGKGERERVKCPLMRLLIHFRPLPVGFVLISRHRLSPFFASFPVARRLNEGPVTSGTRSAVIGWSESEMTGRRERGRSSCGHPRGRGLE
ncbi:hypothetical protein CEXT_42221 [Caerostris extrusa]|uniref:Uncharacterized protein n=1 Tax=Caerostris extrusa TaxID=172846 RepID=A0AAV4PPW1_CAEEX|nr:hypothetical protein CEXT_42221 [Caerostris extrusa]